MGQQLALLARQLQSQQEPQAVMDHLVAAAVAIVPGAEEATISRVQARSHVVSQASTGARARRIDWLQAHTGQGPCLDAMYEQQTVRVRDLAGERRWPRLAACAREVGVGSMLCFQLYVIGENLGALNLVAGAVDAFDDRCEDIGLLVAAHAGIAVADAQQLQQARSAVGSAELIGRATGILMERYQIDAQQARAQLVQAAGSSARSLHQVAVELIDTGRLSR
ncbi:GAF and ANTAR domain-containing protein [Kineococcus sp. SYSU DK005]|uniref:GAF and ANTAR domain-containing protein n=1 Tax=Kineococcus sp. SYSU DK005 TaxID=3383126 RepID=UPI003D7ECF86